MTAQPGADAGDDSLVASLQPRTDTAEGSLCPGAQGRGRLAQGCGQATGSRESPSAGTPFLCVGWVRASGAGLPRPRLHGPGCGHGGATSQRDREGEAERSCQGLAGSASWDRGRSRGCRARAAALAGPGRLSGQAVRCSAPHTCKAQVLRASALPRHPTPQSPQPGGVGHLPGHASPGDAAMLWGPGSERFPGRPAAAG